MVKTILFTKDDVVNDVDVYAIPLEGKIVILKTEFFKEEYRNAKYQLVKATGGFGCNPNAIGNAIFVKEMHTDNPESYRIERCNRNILGIATEKAIAEYKEMFGWREEN